VGDGDERDLPLFHGPHIPRIRFERALERLDLGAAAQDAPEAWRSAVGALAAAVEAGAGRGHARAEALARIGREQWPAVLERTWQRLMGRALDGSGIPATHGGEPAAAFLLRGGEKARARRSIERHLERHPRDAGAWELLARFDPVRGAARCGFHGGPVLDAAGDVIDLVREDEIEPVAPWLLAYAWFSRRIDLDEIRRALAAERMLSTPPLAVPNDARAFAWYLLDAGRRRYVGRSVGVVEARERLKRISAPAFRRYLARV
jgi:hypothetical protein